MQLIELNVYQYQLPLTTSLPVGKQCINVRSGLILQAKALSKMTMDKRANASGRDYKEACVEIAPLSGRDIKGEVIGGFSLDTLEQVLACLREWLPRLCGQNVAQLVSLATQSALPALAFGLSVLHAKLLNKLGNVSLTQPEVPLLYSQGALSLNQQLASLNSRTHTVKLKVAQGAIAADIERVYAILAMRPAVKLRLDANRGFTLSEAIDFAACLPHSAVEYIEEPCANPADNIAFYHAVRLPYALDESLHEPEYEFTMQPGLTALIIKPMLVGSLDRLVNLITNAQSCGVRCILSSSLEASLGIETLSQLAQMLTPDEPPGLDTLSAFEHDVLVSSGKPHCLTLDQLPRILHCALKVS